MLLISKVFPNLNRQHQHLVTATAKSMNNVQQCWNFLCTASNMEGLLQSTIEQYNHQPHSQLRWFKHADSAVASQYPGNLKLEVYERRSKIFAIQYDVQIAQTKQLHYFSM